jgi:hypothetical protein
MDLDPQLPPLPTLTLVSTSLNVPPDKPPDPSISMLFPENPPYRIPENPFRGTAPKAFQEEHKKKLQDALRSVREPFLFRAEEPFIFNGTRVGDDTS